MAITAGGVSFLADAAVGKGVPFDSTNAHLGVGDGSGLFLVTQTDLQGDNTVRRPMESGYPVLTAPSITFKSSFEQSAANFPWNEWGIFNASSGGVMLNRVVEYNGTKLENQTWVLEVKITFVAG